MGVSSLSLLLVVHGALEVAALPGVSAVSAFLMTRVQW